MILTFEENLDTRVRMPRTGILPKHSNQRELTRFPVPDLSFMVSFMYVEIALPPLLK